MHTRQYYCSSSNPAIITYYYRIFLFSSLKIHRNIQTCKLMTCSHHHNIRSHQYIITYCDISIKPSIATQLTSVTYRETQAITKVTMVFHNYICTTTS